MIQEFLYLHKKLRLFHEAINCEQVLVNRLSYVKIDKIRAHFSRACLILIINVEKSILRDCQTNQTHKHKDIKDLELMIVEIMKSKTSLMNAQTLDLRSSKK